MFVYDYKFLVALFILAGTAVALVGWAVYSIIKKMNKPRSVCDISDELLDQIIDRVDAHFKAPTTNVDCDDQRSEVTPL